MKIAGGVLGIIGALIALIAGNIGYGLFSAGNSINQAVGGGAGESAILFVFQSAALVFPVFGLIGAGIAFGQPKLGAIMMALSAILLVYVFGFHFMTLVPVSLLGVGAILAYLDVRLSQEGTATNSVEASKSQLPVKPEELKVGDTIMVFKNKNIVKEEEGVSVDGQSFKNRIAAEIFITNNSI
ncbi:hypothetical protein ROE7235_02773 [Roseibaca ekhonensis]|uniref:Uncharacterized protein n=1 Tax=Roseinatronobacter ekhonensis TaxID=254356 RepID=A0A3B0MAQ2_9RHOB|nr:hypothetical protein [Roseibaca ekhonensis]SUZ33005.1 hypothetical protein ROE7235_02773 [Roseibaca ekhonensis]